jgi:two-component system invasion response regulator UvrY
MRHVLIADDHEVTRRGVRQLLHEGFDGVEVVEAADGEAVMAALPTRRWDLLLLDIMMPGRGILDLLARIRAVDAAVPVLVLTAAVEIEYVFQTMKAGANGLIHKHRASDDLLEAIAKVVGGGTYLHADTAAEVASSLRQEPRTRPHERLSSREFEIFRLIALGRAIKEIASDLDLSDKTVATYLARIREKTGLTSHVEIARYSMQNGLVD